MYILQRNSRIFGVHIKNRTCIIGFQTKEVAKRLFSKLKKSRTKLYLERQKIKTVFDADGLDMIKIIELPDEFNFVMELNNLMLFVTNDVYSYGGILSLDGILMDYDFQNDLQTTRLYYLEDLYNLDEQIIKKYI